MDLAAGLQRVAAQVGRKPWPLLAQLLFQAAQAARPAPHAAPEAAGRRRRDAFRRLEQARVVRVARVVVALERGLARQRAQRLVLHALQRAVVRERGQAREQRAPQAPAQHAQLALAVAVVALHLLVLALDLGDHAAQARVLRPQQLDMCMPRQSLAGGGTIGAASTDASGAGGEGQQQQREQEQDMAIVLDQFFHAASSGESELAIAQWAPHLTALNPAEVEAFVDTLQTRFGAFESVRIGSSQPVSGPSLFELRVECWIIARFDSVDQNVGRLIASLKKMERLGNTIIFFLRLN